jgi:hypothetical protein
MANEISDMNEFMEVMLASFPDAVVDEGDNGELIISTGLVCLDDNEIVSLAAIGIDADVEELISDTISLNELEKE